jgi:hypothetical protein
VLGAANATWRLSRILRVVGSTLDRAAKTLRLARMSRRSSGRSPGWSPFERDPAQRGARSSWIGRIRDRQPPRRNRARPLSRPPQ